MHLARHTNFTNLNPINSNNFSTINHHETINVNITIPYKASQS